jgi:hypothetical protein
VTFRSFIQGLFPVPHAALAVSFYAADHISSLVSQRRCSLGLIMCPVRHFSFLLYRLESGSLVAARNPSENASSISDRTPHTSKLLSAVPMKAYRSCEIDGALEWICFGESPRTSSTTHTLRSEDVSPSLSAAQSRKGVPLLKSAILASRNIRTTKPEFFAD